MEYHSGGSLPLLGRPRYCPGANANGGYLCETGHCCGETGCCTYYYELWWFWLLWTVLILFSCCCAYRHRRAKLRVQQQQRQREISLLAYHGANSYPSSMLDLSFLASLKLPSYEEVAAQPSTPPPPYSSVFTTPRYPQPPRTSDPHLLTQHGPLLHRPLSDGPSSLSSDNSSSCSCDSCCPSSPCSSSLSAPVTYETDTSHATTPSEAAPLTLDVTMETITAAATCLEVNETQFGSERMVAIDISGEDAAGEQEAIDTESSAPNEIVSVAIVTRAVSPQATSPITTSPVKQLDPDTCIVSTCGQGTHHRQSVVNTTLPCIQIISTEGPADSPETTPAPKITAISVPSVPAVSNSDNPTTTQTPDLTRTFDSAHAPSTPTTEPSPDVERTLTLITDSAPDPNPSPFPIPVPSNLTQVPDPELTSITQASIPELKSLTQTVCVIPTNFSQDPEPESTNLTSVRDPVLEIRTQSPDSNLTLEPNPQPKSLMVPDFTVTTDAAPTSLTLDRCQIPELSPQLGQLQCPTSPSSGLPQKPGNVADLSSCLDIVAVPVDSGPSLVLSQLPESDLISPILSNIQAGPVTGSFSGVGPQSTLTPVLTSSACPAITIESESSLTFSQSPPLAFSPSSPQSFPSPPTLPSPPALSCMSLPAPALLLDPFTALHQSNKGGSSSGHASSLSPSPRATQSPPKQTLFSPCVDVFEPEPSSWEDGEEEQDEEDEEEEEDMGADESQYRHRRLTGDSGIEVCRCRVEEEEEEEEKEEEEEEGERKEESRRGRGGGGEGERDKKGSATTYLHDSVDCPARGQITAGEGLTLCSPTSTTTPTSDDTGKVIIVMETM